MRDFTLNTYKSLLTSFIEAGYRIIPFGQYMSGSKEGKTLILRHDVDMRPGNSVITAETEHSLGISASYYFRVVKESNDPEAIRRIASLGHEIGYHYEDMAICSGDKEQAIKHFEEQLRYFRTFYPVSTVCMHGAPANRFDGCDLWRDGNGQRNNGGKYDYRTYGITGEPYFDIDFTRVFYLTDTGCRWDGFNVSVRDKVSEQDRWTRLGWVYHSSEDIINAVRRGEAPFAEGSTVMMTTHPQRWTDSRLLWLREQTMQRIKNVIKKALYV